MFGFSRAIETNIIFLLILIHCPCGQSATLNTVKIGKLMNLNSTVDVFELMTNKF